MSIIIKTASEANKLTKDIINSESDKFYDDKMRTIDNAINKSIKKSLYYTFISDLSLYKNNSFSVRVISELKDLGYNVKPVIHESYFNNIYGIEIRW